MRRPLIAAVAVLLLLTYGPALAAAPPHGSAAAGPPAARAAVPGDWTRNAPAVVNEVELAVSPSDADVVYAAIGTGVARSTDGGATWTHLGVDEGFGRSFSIDNSVAVDPSDGQRVYVGSYVSVLRSSNGGGTFSRVGTDDGLDSIVRGLAVDAGAGPADTRVLATGYVQKVALSTDSGTTWSDKTGNAVAAGLGLSDATVLLHPTDPDVAIIASDSVILRTVNLTSPMPTWTAIQAAPVANRIIDLAIAGGRLLAASSNGQVYRSSNALTKATVNPTWVGSNVTVGFASGLAAVGVSGALVAGSEGLFKTVNLTDSTPDWTEVGGGLPGSAASDVAVSSDGATMYVAAGTGVYRSTNGGISWVERPGIVQGTVRDLASAGGTAYAAATDGGLLRSVDGGRVWDAVTGADDGAALAVAVSPAQPERVFAVLGDQVRRSLDGGTTFAPPVPTAPSSSGLAVDPLDPDVVWSAGEFEKVHRSADGGATWTTLTAGLPDSFRASDIEFAPAVGANPAVVYLAGDEPFVLASSTDGSSWTPLATGLPGGSNDVVDVAVDPANPLHLYAAVSLDNVLYESVNGGASWTKTAGTDDEANPEALDVVQIDAVTFDADGSVLIATGWSFEESGRVYRSADGGLTFAPFGPPMDEVYNDALTLLADAQGVHVGTQGSGVIDLVRSADVGVSVAAPATVAVGKPFAVTVSVTAVGPDPATDVVLTLPRPAGTTVTSPACSGGATLTCVVDAADGTGSVALQVTASSTGAKVFAATVDAAQVDPSTGNNSAADSTTVGKAASRLTMKAKPGRDTSAPHAFVLSGTLTRADGIAAACNGQIRITVAKGSASLSTKQVPLARKQGACRFRLPLTFRKAPADRLVATATYAGSATLKPAKPAKVTLRLT